MDDTPRYIGYPLVYNLLQFAIEAMAQSIYSWFTQLQNGGSFHSFLLTFTRGYETAPLTIHHY